MRNSIIALVLMLWGSVECALPISASQFGKDWPFSVQSGELTCKSKIAVIFTSEGKSYAVNGTAKSMGYGDIEPIWMPDPEMLEYAKSVAQKEGKSLEAIQNEMGLARINMGEILNKGLSICRNQ